MNTYFVLFKGMLYISFMFFLESIRIGILISGLLCKIVFIALAGGILYYN